MDSVLYVDDEVNLLEIGRIFLEESGEFRVETSVSAKKALDLMALRPYDAIISDYQMPGMDGIAFLKAIRERFGDIPFILFTGRGREEVVIDAINNGADFYLQKGGDVDAQFAELSHKIRQAVRRKRAEVALYKNEERMRFALEGANDGIWDVDLTTGRAYLSPRGCEILGYTFEEFQQVSGDWTKLINPLDMSATQEALAQYRAGKTALLEIEQRIRMKSGDWKWILSRGKAVEYDAAGNPVRMTGTHTDITGRKNAEKEILESRRLLDAMASNIPGVVYRIHVTPEGTYGYDYISDRCLQILGIENDRETFFDRFTGCVVPEDRDRFISSVRHAISTKTLWEFEGRFVRPSGETIWVSVISSPKMENDRLVFDGVLFDISDRKRAEQDLVRKNEELNASYEQVAAAEEELRGNLDEMTRTEQALRESETNYRLLADNGSDTIWVMRMDGVFTYHSPAVMQLRGFTPEEANRIGMEQALCPESLAFVRKKFQEEAEKPVGEQWQDGIYELQMYRKDGGTVWVEASVRAIRDRGGNLTGLQGSARDITERKRAEVTLRRLHKKLDVLSQLTHQDLMTQIYVLNSYLELAKSEAKGSEGIIRNIENGERAVRSIREITEFTRDYHNAGAKPPKWQNVKLAFILGLSHIPSGNIRHSIETENLEIFSDQLLEKAFRGLLENSLEHGGRVSRIHVWQVPAPDGITIVFEDDGIGIPPTKKEQIFLYGEGARSSLRGLSFVREILDITGITIRETGEPGKGARFEMMVPKGHYRHASRQ